MDAHVFRRLGQAIIPILTGARLEKIQSPAENIYVFSFYAQKSKQHLILKASRSNPFLYFTKHRPTVNAAPKATIMRMRKYCAAKRIAFCSMDWLNRKLLFLFSSQVKDGVAEYPETWLVLDLRTGPSLVLGQCPSLPIEDDNISWPSTGLGVDADWRTWPILTPTLRKTLPYLDALEQQSLLNDLEVGGGDIFVYGEGEGAELFAWPLAPELVKKRKELIFEDVIQATTLFGDALVLGGAAQNKRNALAAPHKREVARLNRLLQKLQDEEIRLNELVALQEQGLALQNIMWRYDGQAKFESVETKDLGVIKLDPRYSLSDNMQMLFHKAGRGRRGLEYLVERRAKLQEQLEQLKSATGDVLASGMELNIKDNNKSIRHISLPKGVESFNSEDGFIILRGKDAKGNWAALRMASGHDLWMHVEGGPGAHCIIKRHFSGQDVPEATLHEAAKLAAIKSWQKDSPSAQIILAEVRHVKPMRNAAAGTVRIDKVFKTFMVNLIE